MDKQQAKYIIEETFEKPFDKNRFIHFIKNLLSRVEEAPFAYHGQFIPEAYRQYISILERIGKFNDGENRIDILIIKLQRETSLERARTNQRNFVAGYLQGKYGSSNEKEAALVAFVSPDNTDWRFSLVKMDYKFEQTPTGKMKVKEEFTPARRWSFLVGANERSHTAQSRLVNILANDEQVPTLAELEKAFDIETVTKEFFLKYRDLFIRTKEALDKVVKNDVRIKADFEAKGVNTVDFAKKLLGQIVFLYFLQKKGWFGVQRDAEWGTGPKHFLRELFDGKHGKYKNFFNDILEPLFYEALRIDRSHDDDYYSHFNCKIPFLNGGLFDPINNYDWVHADILLPNELFSNTLKTREGDTGNGILDIFDRYNFTVKEDEPLEKEVAIDPELLGKAYEKFNVIRPDNYEEYKEALKSGQKGAENKFNKQYGVYYTPREIVHYMCQQSLTSYLATELSPVIPSEARNLKEDIDTLIKYGEQVGENEAIVETKGRETRTYFYKLPESIRQNAKVVDEKLADIKVCDPAVGSGAFPVGMMSEIVKTRNVLSAFIKDNKRKLYSFKRECIEKSLYGVDIDPGAVEIAKLRLWLSLVVDEEDIKQIKPLPNLDYKIVCGNSLLGVEKNLLNDALFKELEHFKPIIFNETNPKKKNEYKKQIDTLINQITNGHKEFDFGVYFSEVFHEKGGFHVVITNPPYLGESGHKEIFRQIKKGVLKEFYQGKMDLFYFFFSLALNLGRGNSQIGLITTNYYPTATGGKILRKDLKKRAIIKQFINFNELKIFESALGQHNMITILEKGENENSIVQTCVTQRQGTATPEILQKILKGNDIETHYYKVAQKDLYDGDEYYIRMTGSSEIKDSPIQIILEKVKNQGDPLGLICNVNQGIVTGANFLTEFNKVKYNITDANIGDGIFLITNNELKSLNLLNKEEKIVRPLFKNSDIFKYHTNIKNELNIINLKYTDKPNVKEYPNIGRHLLRFKELLLDRPRTGTLESAFSKGYWYVLTTSRKANFEGPKIVCPYRSNFNTFGYNEIPWYALTDVYVITGKDYSISLKHILSLLNSKLYYFWLYHKGKRKGEILELFQIPLSEIPIKKISLTEQHPFITLVDRILAITKNEDYLENSAKQMQVKALEREIDQIVYKLYGLTEEEIRIVEGE